MCHGHDQNLASRIINTQNKTFTNYVEPSKTHI